MIPDGLHPELSEAEYRALNLPSCSELATLDRSPDAWLHRHLTPIEPTPAMRYGTLVHSLVLSRCVPEGWCVRPEGLDGRTREGRAWFAEHAGDAGDTVIPLEDWTRAHRAAESLRSHPALSRWLTTGQTEVSMVWTDPGSGVQVKGRADLVVTDPLLGPLVVDLKLLSVGCEREAVRRAVYASGYWLQVPAYAWGYELCGGPASRAVIVACDSGDVPGVEIYPMDEPWQYRGLTRVRKLLCDLAECQRTGYYPADTRHLRGVNEDLEAPRWADV